MNNESAFPFVVHDISKYQVHEPGLSKREYIAVQIAAGMCSAESETDGFWEDEKLVALAVKRADALLEALKS